MLIQFFVPGIPKPGGSKTGFYNKKLNRVLMVDASKNQDWKSSVKSFALQIYKDNPLMVPLILSVEFVMPRPRSHYRSGKNRDEMKKSAPKFHDKKPDATKLTRCLEDALTGILWKDDSQIVEQNIRKIFGEKPGASIRVVGIELDEPGKERETKTIKGPSVNRVDLDGII